jgi:ribonuclease HI
LIEIYLDGLCQPVNPCGIACYAFVAKKEGKNIKIDYGMAGEPFTKDATNNVAEYTALIKVLEWLLANNLNSECVQINSDSQLVVKQLNEEYKVKSRRILPLYREVLQLKNNFKDIDIRWIAREENKEADALTNKAYMRALQDNPEYLDRIL